MVLRLLITPVLLSLLSGCGKIVFPDASQYQPARANVTKHRVAKGETLYSIAYHYGVEHQTLAGWNNIGEPYPIYVGQLLTIKPQINHRVTKGETLYAIAFRYGVDYHALAITNAIKPPYRIFVGDELTVIPQANLPVAPMARSGWQDKQPTGQTAARTAPYIEPNNAQKSHKRQPKKSASYNSKREI